MTTTWHADVALLAGYADGSIDEARAYSVEAHLLACAACRVAVAAHASPPLDRMWTRIEDVLDGSRLSGFGASLPARHWQSTTRGSRPRSGSR